MSDLPRVPAREQDGSTNPEGLPDYEKISGEDIANMSRKEVQQELDRRGIDVSSAVARVLAAVRKAKQP